jgi:hypothetical protein
MEEFNNLGLEGITWDQFGNAREADIDDLLINQNIHGSRRIVVMDLWKRHPKRKGKIYLILLFLLLYLIQNFVL